MAIPTGVTAGIGVVNLVNSKVKSLGSNANGIDVQGCPSSTSKVTMVLRFSDIIATSGYSALVGEFGCNPATEWIIDSILHTGFSYWASLLDNSAFPTNVYGTTAASYGTSQYPAGYAPVPTTRLREVGTGKTYSTVRAAYDAATHGDNIVIYPGTYDCTSFNRCGGTNTTIDKCVRFYGATEDPDDVILQITGASICYGGHGFCFMPYLYTNVPEAERGPGMFHVTIERTDPESWETPFGAYRTSETYTDPNPWIPDTAIPANAIMFSCNT